MDASLVFRRGQDRFVAPQAVAPDPIPGVYRFRILAVLASEGVGNVIGGIAGKVLAALVVEPVVVAGVDFVVPEIEDVAMAVVPVIEVPAVLEADGLEDVA